MLCGSLSAKVDISHWQNLWSPKPDPLWMRPCCSHTLALANGNLGFKECAWWAALRTSLGRDEWFTLLLKEWRQCWDTLPLNNDSCFFPPRSIKVASVTHLETYILIWAFKRLWCCPIMATSVPTEDLILCTLRYVLADADIGWVEMHHGTASCPKEIQIQSDAYLMDGASTHLGTHISITNVHNLGILWLCHDWRSHQNNKDQFIGRLWAGLYFMEI